MSITGGDNCGPVWITGATRGIGRAVARAFLKSGFTVSAIWHEDFHAARETCDEFKPFGDRFHLSPCDVTDPHRVQAWAAECLQRSGPPGCAIHNAGFAVNATLLNVSEKDWDGMIAVHLNGARNLVHACLRPMLDSGGGQFLFVSSVVATTGNIGQCAYTSAKAGLLGFSRSLGREYGRRNIRSNVILPGFHETRLSKELTPKVREAIRARHLLPVTTSLEETASFFVWLTRTRTISGQVFNLDSRIPGWL